MIVYSLISENGNRSINEDSVAAVQKQNKYCFTLCDGLGGHGSGDVASSTVTDTFSKLFLESDEEPKKFFETAYTQANKNVLEAQKANPGSFDMKTTVVSLYISENECVWSHLGDSRLYCFEKNAVKVRTLDHSVPQMLVQSKEIKEKDIRYHPDRNKILRVVGVDEVTPRYQLSETVNIGDCKAFLLCSDGFWELISEKRMCRCLRKSKTPEEWLKRMRNAVVKKGENRNMDNFSAIAIYIK